MSIIERVSSLPPTSPLEKEKVWSGEGYEKVEVWSERGMKK